MRHSVVACYGMERRRWFSPSPDLHRRIWPSRELNHETRAFELLFGGTTQAKPVQANASRWIEHRGAFRHTVFEPSVKLDEDAVLTFLWWKAPSQIRELLS